MKTFSIILGVLTFIGIGIYFFLRKKQISLANTTDLNSSGTTNILEKIKVATNINSPNTGTTPTGTETGTGTGTGTGIGTGTGLTELLALTYEGGQKIYAKLNGVKVESSAIGYLTDKSKLYLKDVEYRDGEYKKKTTDETYNENGVNTREVYGIVPIANEFGTFDVTVYKFHKTLLIANFPKGVGFNVQGFIVYKDIFDLGSLGTFPYYYY